MATAGLWMLLAVALLMVTTGLAAWVLLIAVALVAAVLGVASGAVPAGLFTVLPVRILSLLESDLLQALPLYVFMGALLNRLPLADALFCVVRRLLRGTGASAPLAGLGMGVVLAPMNGSVGAGVSMFARMLYPRLDAAGMSTSRAAALVVVTSSLGVVMPPSLVLILLGDAMMRAHTEAVNATHAAVRVVNEHDIFRGALWPAAAVLLAWALVAWWTGRAPAQAEAPRRNQWLAAAVTTLLIGGLLGGVTLGYLYAVEAAAAGGMALLVFALAAGAVSRRLLLAVLRDTIVTTGALFALLVGATVFTLVLRVFETDRWVAATLAEFASPAAVLVAVLALIALCAFVLDAFEIIFVVIPVVMPPLLTRVDDAVWVSVLTLLILQASFVLPPFGYAIMLVRRRLAGANLAPGLRLRELARACVPYLLAQLAVLMLVLAWPRITGPGPESIAPAPTPANGKEPDLGELLRQQSGAPEAQ